MKRLALLILALVACKADPPPPKADPSTSSPLVVARGVRIGKGGDEPDLAKLVKSEGDRAKGEGRDLVVYVGATWCEPCKRFHAAAARGELDDAFPSLTLLEFDLDVDRDRLATAGYTSKLVPLFALPHADGRASERHIEGSVKGDKAVANITPRLRAMLAK